MDPLILHLRSGYPILRVISWEEETTLASVVACCRTLFGDAVELFGWDSLNGLQPTSDGRHSLDDALELAGRIPGPAVFLIKDLPPLTDQSPTCRAIRELPRAIGDRDVRVVFVTPPGPIAPTLHREMPSVRLSMPGVPPLLELVHSEVAAEQLREDLTPLQLANALRGLTLLEARLALRRVLAIGPLDDLTLRRLFEEKARKGTTSALEFCPPDLGLSDIGGLDALKQWVATRFAVFKQSGQLPRGILLTGVAGCGKSFVIKSLSLAFGVPLFRLDMARVFASPEPEEAFISALDAIESLAPCIMWIDEIENALALGVQDTGSASRIAGYFLTWMQDRPQGTFVGATANRIELLAAELLRRGRFDQIFFVDLPDQEERKTIWASHLRRQSIDPDVHDLILLAHSTKGWSGAEIAGAVDTAVVAAAEESVTPTKLHFLRAIGQCVPLSVTMEEQIRKIKAWAHGRAMSASGRKL